MSRNQQAAGLQAKVSEMEAELDSTRQEQRTFGSVFAAKERDQVRKLESLQDEVGGAGGAGQQGGRADGRTGGRAAGRTGGRAAGRTRGRAVGWH